jgi:hypothetical protein
MTLECFRVLVPALAFEHLVAAQVAENVKTNERNREQQNDEYQ